MAKNLSRRSFLKGTAIGALGLAVSGVSLASAEEHPACTYADTIAWDGQYDVVVLGFGGAGAWATLAAAKKGANVLVTDAAPRGKEGGNFRLSGQIFLEYENEEDAYSFFKSQYTGLDMDEDIARFYARELTQTSKYLEQIGIARDEWVDATEAWNFGCAFGYPGAESRKEYCAHNGNYDAYLWKHLRSAIEAEAAHVDLWLESPARHLIKAPDTGIVIGVEIEHEGHMVKIRALNGVVLATGGYENNQRMMQDYLNIPVGVCMATPYNKGQGITMALEAGADLWHTFVYDGLGFWGGAAVPTPVGEMLPNNNMMSIAPMRNGSVYAINQGGTRFVNEAQKTDHGRGPWGGTWCNPRWTPHNYMVMDKAGYDELVADGAFADYLDQFVSADSVNELAAAIDVDAAGLQQTIDDIPVFIAMGHDPITARDVSTMRPFGEGPYYALPIYPGFHGTRGGPRRNANCEIMGANGQPIGHLYGAGECGSIYANIRGGGSGITECIIMGYYAGEKAAEPKDELPIFAGGIPAESPMTYTIGSGSSVLLAEEIIYETADNQYIGTSPNGLAGDVKVRITTEDRKMTNVEVIEHHETEGIGTKAAEIMPGRILEAQSTNVDTVSGATVTSKAILEAVADAMAQAGL